MTMLRSRSAFDTFAQRCHELRLLTWWCDADGAIVSEPTLPLAVQPILDSPLLRHSIEKAARMTLAGPDDDAVDFTFPGAALILLTSRRNSSEADGVSASLLMTAAFADTPQFELICREAALDPATAALELAPWMAHPPENIELMRRTLLWMHADLLAAQRDKQAINEFSENLLQAYEQTHLLFRLARMLNGRNDPRMLMQVMCEQLLPVLPFRWVAARFASGRGVLADLSGQLLLAGELPCPSERFDTLAADLVERCTVDDWTRLLDPSRNELAALVNAEVIAEPISHDGEAVGVLLVGNKTGDDPEVSSVETQFLEAAADFLGVFHENIARFHEERALFLGTLGALTASIDAKDRYTCGHSERVSHLAQCIAQKMQLPSEVVEKVRIAGLVHDVGKIGVPEHVLCKPGRLTDEEFEQIKRHPVIGYSILKDIQPLEDMLPGVLYHHERWDGRGYPEGLSGENIPLFGRIIGVADTFDAMSSSRSYRAAMPREKVMAELERSAGTQLDPQVVAVFKQVDLTEYDAMLQRHAVGIQPESSQLSSNH